jgi:hypothetical protein
MLLEPVDHLTITTLIDNSVDLFMPARSMLLASDQRA